jgi:hypothetical protein
MTKATRARYTLEFKQEAVRLVESGQSIAAASRTLGLVEQTLFNWVRAPPRLFPYCSRRDNRPISPACPKTALTSRETMLPQNLIDG